MNYINHFLYIGITTTMAFSCKPVENGNTKLTRENSKEKKPNIIILFADDMGYGDAACYGHPTIKTPNIDRMADEGVKLTQFYVSAPICSPSRGALLTGRLPVRTGMHTGVFFPDSEKGIPDEEITIAETLKKNGYATAIFGKWHLGHHEQYLPTNHGFDEYFGIPYSNNMEPKPGWERSKSFPLTPLIEGTKTIEEGPDQSLLTRRYTEHSIDFIKRNKNKPFFLYLPYTMPHVPIYASEKFEGQSRRGLYGDVIEEIDWSVGEILKTLEETELDKNTFVFFTSDNGPWLSERQEGGSAGLLREGKGTCFEGGMREPAIAWWPGTIESGNVEMAVTSSLDLFPTCLSVANVDMPDDRVFDGYNLLPLLTGKTEKVREEIFYYRGSFLHAVRKGPWKLHFRIIENPYTDEANYEDVSEDPLLFNLEIDPSEKYNVAKDHPDIIENLTRFAEKHKNSFEIVPSVISPRKEKK